MIFKHSGLHSILETVCFHTNTNIQAIHTQRGRGKAPKLMFYNMYRDIQYITTSLSVYVCVCCVCLRLHILLYVCVYLKCVYVIAIERERERGRGREFTL